MWVRRWTRTPGTVREDVGAHLKRSEARFYTSGKAPSMINNDDPPGEDRGPDWTGASSKQNILDQTGPELVSREPDNVLVLRPQQVVSSLFTTFRGRQAVYTVHVLLRTKDGFIRFPSSLSASLKPEMCFKRLSVSAEDADICRTLHRFRPPQVLLPRTDEPGVETRHDS